MTHYTETANTPSRTCLSHFNSMLHSILYKPLNNLNHFLTTIMITTLSTVFYVISLSEDKNSKSTIQKGQAISRNNNDGINFLVYNFSQSEDATDFLPLQPL